MKLFESKFSKNIVTLVTGTALAQAIPLALSPILTRLYTPQDFGILAAYISIFALAIAFVSLKYDLAIIIPEKDEDSINITVLSILISFIISIILFILILFFNEKLSYFLIEDNPKEAKELSKWLFFIPISVFLMGLFNAISFWFNRKSLYKRMATSKIINTSGMTGIQIISGSISGTAISLLTGFIVGRFFSVLYLLNRFYKDKDFIISSINRKKMLFLMMKYKKFPLFSLPAGFVNILSNQLPVFFIGKYFGTVLLGNYALMERVLSAPISLLGKSVLDVFKQKASEDYIRYGNCKNIFIKTFRTLVMLSIIPSFFLFFLSPIVFKLLFGKEWLISGEFAQIFSFLFFFKFTASPLSYMFIIAEKQIYDMLWQISLLICTIVSFSIGIYYNEIKLALICFVFSYSFLYVVNLYFAYSFSKGELRNSD